MTAYVDTSAILKRYVDEPDAERADALLASSADLITGRHTLVEVRRNLGRLLGGRDLAAARAAFVEDQAALNLVELDPATCELAATIAEETGVRTLDALHLGAALRIGTTITFITFDVRQAQTARSLGFAVAGA